MRQLVGPSNTFAGGRLVRVEGGGGPYEALIKADLLQFTMWRPHRELGGSKGKNTGRGMRAYPPIPTLSTCSACRPA